MGQLLDCQFPSKSRTLVKNVLKVNKVPRSLGSGCLGSGSLIVGFQPLLRVISDPGVEFP